MFRFKRHTDTTHTFPKSVEEGLAMGVKASELPNPATLKKREDRPSRKVTDADVAMVFQSMGTHGNRYAALKTIKAKHWTVIRYHLAGVSNQDIANLVQMSPQHIGKILNSPLVKRRIAEMVAEQNAIFQDDLSNDIRELAPLALAKIEELMDAEKEETQFKAARFVLESSGNGPIKRSVNVNKTMTDDKLKEIKERALALARETGMSASNDVEDAEVVEIT